MSRTFKRPMFRKGGNVGNGIMSGITDRVQAKAGYPDPTLDMIAEETVTTPNYTEEYIKAIREAGGTGPVGMDPLTSYLLTAGPAIAGATSFSDAISKLGDPNKALIERMQRAAEAERNLRIGATQFGLEKGFAEKEAEKDREIERQKISSAEKRARIMAEGKDPTLTLDEKITARAETLMEDYRNNRRYATNHATYIEDIQDKLPAGKDKGIVKDSKTLEKIRQKGKKEAGNIYFDVTDGIAKELVLDEATGQYRWRDYLKAQETITDTTTVEDTGDKDTPAPKDYKTFIDEELKKQREKKRRELLEKYGVEDDLYSDFTSGQ